MCATGETSGKRKWCRREEHVTWPHRAQGDALCTSNEETCSALAQPLPYLDLWVLPLAVGPGSLMVTTAAGGSGGRALRRDVTLAMRQVRLCMTLAALHKNQSKPVTDVASAVFGPRSVPSACAVCAPASDAQALRPSVPAVRHRVPGHGGAANCGPRAAVLEAAPGALANRPSFPRPGRFAVGAVALATSVCAGADAAKRALVPTTFRQCARLRAEATGGGKPPVVQLVQAGAATVSTSHCRRTAWRFGT